MPNPRSGQLLRIKDRPLEFSFWPMERTTRRYGLGARVFATDPWTVIRRSVETRCPADSRKAAFALLEQSEDFYHAAESGVKAAKPVLLYYCFMNLAKAFVLTTRQRTVVDDAQHGLNEKLDQVPNSKELTNAFLNACPSLPPGPVPPNQKIKVFDELLRAVCGQGLTADPTRLDLPELLPQIVPGHRLWAASAAVKERFISIERVEFWQAVQDKAIWLRLFVFADDLKRINLTRQQLLEQTGLAGVLQEVSWDERKDERAVFCLEQVQTVTYTHRPSDLVHSLVSTLRHKLWRTVLAMPPYRKYYLYPTPGAQGQVLPQILSIYAITFYLGSITRYRPHHFDAILAAPFGPFIEAFLNDQPTQFLYLMSSEFAEKEVTKAAIV